VAPKTQGIRFEIHLEGTMIFLMNRLICEFQVFQSVVRSFVIDVMNHFAPLQLATKVFFHYESMLKAVSVRVRSFFGWNPNMLISIPVKSISTVPLRIKLLLVSALHRTKLCSFFASPKPSEFFTAVLAITSFNHFSHSKTSYGYYTP